MPRQSKLVGTTAVNILLYYYISGFLPNIPIYFIMSTLSPIKLIDLSPHPFSLCCNKCLIISLSVTSLIAIPKANLVIYNLFNISKNHDRNSMYLIINFGWISLQMKSLTGNNILGKLKTGNIHISSVCKTQRKHIV